MGYFLKKRTSENYAIKIHRSQGLSVCGNLFNERETLNSSTIELLLKATAVWLLQAVFPGNIRLQISYVAFSFKTLKH